MIKIVTKNKIYNGNQFVCSHFSELLKCTMKFGIYIPNHRKLELMPVLYWLSGLTCTEENFITKAGAQRVASKLGLILIAPDTSPRNLHIPGEDDTDDFGAGAGFYLDATCQPWSTNYKMYTYITQELRELVENNFPIDNKRLGIFGHSMGGHGALSLALKNPEIFHSVSAFAPISSLIQSPWGRKALLGYLGSDEAQWRQYDVCTLLATKGWNGTRILVDQGSNDPFLNEQLKPDILEKACRKAKVNLDLRIQQGYDHSYYFITTFIEDHLRHHASILKD